MTKGYLTIEAVFSVLALLLILELITTISQLRVPKRYTFMEGGPSCDIECLLYLEQP